MPEVSLEEAAVALGVSRSTIVRRIKRGEIGGRKQHRDGHDIWRVTLPNEDDEPVAERTNVDPDDGEDNTQGVNEEALAEAMALESAILCPVCLKPIEDDDDYTDSAHGQVHTEPCSHKTIPLRSGI